MSKRAFPGFCIELIERLAAILRFNYTFIEQENGAYGTKQPNGEWDGMIGRLRSDRVSGASLGHPALSQILIIIIIVKPQDTLVASVRSVATPRSPQ